MNNATNNLEDDHVYILKLIDVMEKMAGMADPKVQHLEEVVAIIQNFADGLHHAKEESLLFPLMAQHGFSTLQGPVAVMLHEHTLGRNYVKEMIENIRLLKEGDISSLNLIYKNMLGYAMLLRNHIAKENNMLFRMADNALSEHEQHSLLRQFIQIENEAKPNNKKSDFIARIDMLVKFHLS